MVRNLLVAAASSLLLLSLTSCSEGGGSTERPQRADSLCDLREKSTTYTALSNIMGPREVRSIQYLTSQKLSTRLRHDTKDADSVTPELPFCSFYSKGSSEGSGLSVTFNWVSARDASEAKRSQDNFAYFKIDESAVASSKRGSAYVHVRCAIKGLPEVVRQRTLVSSLANSQTSSPADELNEKQVIVLRALTSLVTEQLQCAGGPLDEEAPLKAHKTEWEAVHAK